MKLFKILFSNDINFFNDFIFMKNIKELDKNKHYDIALVHGCSNYNIMNKRIEAAYKLYKEGIINKIYLTGGIGLLSKNKKEPEALVMKKYLLNKGVNEEDIVTELKSKYTKQNIRNFLKKIKKEYNKKINIILVTSSFTI